MRINGRRRESIATTRSLLSCKSLRLRTASLGVFFAVFTLCCGTVHGQTSPENTLPDRMAAYNNAAPYTGTTREPVPAPLGVTTATNVSTQQQLDDLRAELRAQEERFNLLLNRAQEKSLEFTTRIETLESSRADADRQLENRVPSFKALPADQVQELEETLGWSKKLDNFVFFHGYLRSGVGVNGEGGAMQYFRAPGAGAKYRLGNESDTYGEIDLSKDWAAKDGGPQYHTEIMGSFATMELNGSSDRDSFALRQCFVEATNFAPFPEWKFWAGERYYDRHDIHIIDFYLLDMSGYGGGVRDIEVPGGKLGVAVFGSSTTEWETTVGNIDKQSLDLRYYDVPVPLGTGLFWADLAMQPGGNVTSTGEEISTSRGYALGFIHVHDKLWGGFNKCSVQWGQGPAANFSSTLQAPNLQNDGASQFLFTETLTIEPIEDKLSMQATTVTRVIDTGDGTPGRTIWYSAGLRPIWHFTKYFSLAAEYGADWVNDEPDNAKGTLHKFTICPQLSAGNNFFSRPALRAFATYAVWPDSLKGKVGGAAYADATEGWSFGCQMETWW